MFINYNEINVILQIHQINNFDLFMELLIFKSTLYCILISFYLVS